MALTIRIGKIECRRGAYELPQDEDTWTKDQIAKGTLNWSTLNMMQCAVHPKEYSRVSTCTSAKEMWDKLELIYEGTSEKRESKDLSIDPQSSVDSRRKTQFGKSNGHAVWGFFGGACLFKSPPLSIKRDP
ncbi:hypothetical protein Taro_053900 [Colocasia esculenta]|uniref:Uncharacterized protein n=1 Tax=Colocasia esculenta TaxID=4460 RepID=A0A843XP43_COLES|nr:hypothetical protein [Colocasia esculenta]